MNRSPTRFALVASLALVARPDAGCRGDSSGATYHENRIREVHEGGATGDYVELQAFAAGQNLVGGKYINTYDGGGGTPLTDYTIPTNVTNGANQATILIANTPMVNGGHGGLQRRARSQRRQHRRNRLLHGHLDHRRARLRRIRRGRRWERHGAHLHPSAVRHSIRPARRGPRRQSLVRTIAQGCGSSLDPADDTNSAADFTLGPGSPRNNAATPTETPCAASPATPAPTTTAAKKKCKKEKKKHSAEGAKKKKCKKKKKKH